MKIKPAILFIFLAFYCKLQGQNSTFSPYSHYGVGELAPQTLAHTAGMGGAFIALKQDSTVPIFINTGNPAAYALIKLTALEVGGRFQYSNFKTNSTSLNKYTTNFSYGALGFPIRGNGGACFGIMPYSYVGYETKTTENETNIGSVTYQYTGDGGLNKAFLGYGIMPFNKRLTRFRNKHLYIADSLKRLGRGAYLLREFNSKVLSDFSMGFNVNYLFGNISDVTKVIYPSNLLYNNTLRERNMNMGSFTGNFGFQTAITIDSVINRKGKQDKITKELKRLKEEEGLSEQYLQSVKKRLEDSIPLQKRALKEKIKFTLGYFSNINNSMNVNYSSGAYNYVLNGAGQEILRDTAYTNYDQKSSLTLPLEQGFGLGFKKGERLNLVFDFALTNWQNFKYLNDVNDFKNNYRVAGGFNYVPEKYAGGRGSFYRRMNYRFGASYNTGYINIKNNLVSDYGLTLGLGIPVGASRYVSSMVNLALQYGQVRGNSSSLVKENYFRVTFGFTFSDRWFQKFRYD